MPASTARSPGYRRAVPTVPAFDRPDGCSGVASVLQSLGVESAARPIVSVVIVSDYASGEPDGWQDLRATLRGLAGQDCGEAAEYLLVESATIAPHIPAGLIDLRPGLRVVVVDEQSAAALKNAGALAARAELVAMIDGDCVPAPDWLRQLVDAMRVRPAAAATSGQTTYGGAGIVARSMAVVNRAFLDVGRLAPTRHLTMNNCILRRPVLLAHPIPAAAATHMSMLQAAAIQEAGGQLWVEPAARVRHAYDGWSTERQIRRSIGYGVIATRRLNPRLPYASLARLGYLSVALFVVLRTLHSWWLAVQRGRRYGIRWYELPVTFGLSAAACGMEVPGMIRAVRGLPPPPTRFR